MKLFVPSLLLIIALTGLVELSAQQPRKWALEGSVHFNFALNEFETIDDAGFGADMTLRVAIWKRSGLMVEAAADWFIGDKLYFENGYNDLPEFYQLRVGPYLQPTRSLLVGATIGLARYRIREIDFTTDPSFRLPVLLYFGKKGRFHAKVSFTGVIREPRTLSFFGAGLGLRIL